MNLEDLTQENRDHILSMLKDDEQYYGEYGKQFLSNSDISKLLKNPREFKKDTEPNIHLLVGRAFHTAVLEPEKMGQFNVIDSSSRYTNKYKSESGGEMTLLTSDMDNINMMKDAIDANDLVQGILRGPNVEYEVPGFGEVMGELWKGKADALNHDDRLIIDVKTTSDISKFHVSAKRYNYDSQAYIYNQLFGYDMVFVVIDKKTHQLGFYDCSENFYLGGKDKVIEAVTAYRLYFKDQDEFDWSNFLITETL